LNRPITSSETESVIKKTPQKQKSRSRQLHRLILPTFKEELIPILLKLFQKIQEGKHPNSFYEANITLLPKPDKDTTKKRTIHHNLSRI